MFKFEVNHTPRPRNIPISALSGQLLLVKPEAIIGYPATFCLPHAESKNA